MSNKIDEAIDRAGSHFSSQSPPKFAIMEWVATWKFRPPESWP